MDLVRKHYCVNAVIVAGMLMGRNARLVVHTALLAYIQSVINLRENVRDFVKKGGLVNDVILIVMLLIAKPVLIMIKTYASNAMIHFIVKQFPLVQHVQEIV